MYNGHKRVHVKRVQFRSVVVPISLLAGPELRGGGCKGGGGCDNPPEILFGSSVGRSAESGEKHMNNEFN